LTALETVKALRQKLQQGQEGREDEREGGGVAL
jgi:hypothetical protein